MILRKLLIDQQQWHKRLCELTTFISWLMEHLVTKDYGFSKYTVGLKALAENDEKILEF